MDDNSFMEFGMHEGTKLANVPAQYFLWLYEQGWFEKSKQPGHVELRKYIKENLDVIKAEQKRAAS